MWRAPTPAPCPPPPPPTPDVSHGSVFGPARLAWVSRGPPGSGCAVFGAARLAWVGLGVPSPSSSSAASFPSSGSDGFFAPASAGLAADGNAEFFISQLLAVETQLVTQAPSGLLGPAGFADGNSEIVASPL